MDREIISETSPKNCVVEVLGLTHERAQEIAEMAYKVQDENSGTMEQIQDF